MSREFNKNLVRPRTNTEVAEFKRKKKGKKAADADDNMGELPAIASAHTTSQSAILMHGHVYFH